MNKRIRVGIFFAGPSREREISFAGGRTVYDNLDKSLFEPVPIFVDSLGNFILLDWRYLYQGSIRDFYPPTELLAPSHFQIYMESLGQLEEAQLAQLISRVGKLVLPQQFKELFDIVFLAFHGPYGEDGSIQGLLEWYHIPYTGTGILGSALGIDKIHQKRLMKQAGFPTAPYQVLSKSSWQRADKTQLLEEMIVSLGLPLVVKTPRQGSSIGVTIVREKDLGLLTKSIDSCLFVEHITAQEWYKMGFEDKQKWVAKLIDLRSGIGLPVRVKEQVIDHPDDLLAYLEHHFVTCPEEIIELTSLQGEEAVLIESFITGREFSCIILQEAGKSPVALPPTEMLKGELHFDYRAKYLPGLVRKETPMQVSDITLNAIRQACVALYQFLGCQVYARIDGLLSTDDQIYLNDPNTTAGMNPSSFLFHQAAEIGLNPSQLLTFIIRNSLAERVGSHKIRPHAIALLHALDQHLTKHVPRLPKVFDLAEGSI